MNNEKDKGKDRSQPGYSNTANPGHADIHDAVDNLDKYRCEGDVDGDGRAD